MMRGEVLAVASSSSPGQLRRLQGLDITLPTTTVVISVTTANGYTNHVGTAGGASWVFNIHSNEGNWDVY
ncbi:MAG: hypothetical protein WCC17_12710 [Candidatus Nitrosopolaris sp.]